MPSNCSVMAHSHLLTQSPAADVKMKNFPQRQSLQSSEVVLDKRQFRNKSLWFITVPVDGGKTYVLLTTICLPWFHDDDTIYCQSRYALCNTGKSWFSQSRTLSHPNTRWQSKLHRLNYHVFQKTSKDIHHRIGQYEPLHLLLFASGQFLLKVVKSSSPSGSRVSRS